MDNLLSDAPRTKLKDIELFIGLMLIMSGLFVMFLVYIFYLVSVRSTDYISPAEQPSEMLNKMTQDKVDRKN